MTYFKETELGCKPSLPNVMEREGFVVSKPDSFLRYINFVFAVSYVKKVRRTISRICYPNVEYLLRGFLMDTITILDCTETRSLNYLDQGTVKQLNLHSWG